MAVRLANRMSGIAYDEAEMDAIDPSLVDQGCIMYVLYSETSYYYNNETWSLLPNIQKDNTDAITQLESDKQNTLISGTSIKTINGDSVLGIGNLVVTGSGADWGNIIGTLSDQTDLQTALNLKANLASPTFTGTVGGITKTMVGLGNVDNTSDASKPVSTAQQTALDTKVDENGAITGATKTKVTYDTKGLVTAGADATTADINDSSNKRYVTDAQLVVIGNTSGTNTGNQNLTPYFNKDVDDSDDITEGGTKLFLTTSERSKLSNTSGVNTGDQTTISGNAGTASNLSGAPTLPNGTAATTQSQANNSTSLATTAYVDTGLGTKQAALVSATNIKTINGSSVLGSGDLVVSGAQPDIPLAKQTPTSNQTVTAGYSGYISGKYEIGNGLTLEIENTAILEIG